MQCNCIGCASGVLTFYTCSKRISGFDMAPPASAMLATAVAAAGIFYPHSFSISIFP